MVFGLSHLLDNDENDQTMFSGPVRICQMYQNIISSQKSKIKHFGRMIWALSYVLTNTHCGNPKLNQIMLELSFVAQIYELHVYGTIMMNIKNNRARADLVID